MSIIHFNKFFIYKKYHMKKLFTLLIAPQSHSPLRLSGHDSFLQAPQYLRATFAFFIATLFVLGDVFGQTTTFTANGTFNVPAGVTSVTVEAWGGGGAGGGTNAAASRGGGGGAGGSYTKTTVSVTPSAAINVTIGAGGLGVSNGNGGVGGTSTFASSSPVTAIGGNGGNVGNGATNYGLGASLTTGVTFNGGAGSNAVSSGVNSTSGAGGGGAGSTGSGGNASAATAGAAGTGGGGIGASGLGFGANISGNNSIALGGGGGGARSSAVGAAALTGGNGFRGQITVTYVIASITGNNDPICSGDNATFNLTGTPGATVSYNINGNPNTVILTGGSATVTVTGATSDQVLTLIDVTNGSLVQPLTGSSTVVVNTLPAQPVVTVSDNSGLTNNDGVICSNQSATLGTSSSSYSAWKWTNAANTVVSSISTATVTNTDLYKVEITDGNGCKSTSTNVNIIANAIPAVPTITFTENKGTTANDGIICAGDAITLNGPLSLTKYEWSSPAFMSTSSNVYTLTPAASTTFSLTVTNSNGCVNSNTASVVVNALPTISLVSPATTYDVCEGSTITLSGSGTAFSPVAWGSSDDLIATVTNAGVVSGVSYGTADIKYTDDKKCSIEKTVTVLDLPVVADKTVSAVCSDVALGTPTYNTSSSTVAASTFTIVSVAPASGLTQSAGSGTGNDLSDDAWTNTTSGALNVVYTIKPTAANGCDGATFTYTVPINPEPVVTAQTAMTCSDVALNLNLDALISGSGDTYTYTVASSDATNVPAGSARTTASASNITDSYTNTTVSNVTITYTITPIGSNGCSGNAFTYTVTVKPEPVVNNQTAMTCSDVALNLNLATLVSGGTFTYTVASSDATNVPAGLARATASASNITDPYTNTTGSDVTITYTITPIGSNGCSGNTFTYTVTVKPEPVVSNQTAMTCSDVALNLNLATLVSGGTFTYTVASSDATNVPAGSARTTASAASITDTYTNTTASDVTITYTITPIGSNGCSGNGFTYTVTVKPEPVVSNQTAMTCSDVALNLNLATLVSGGTFTYTLASSDATNVPAGLARTTASASNITDTYTNTTGSDVTITYTITPIGSNGCSGNTFTYTVTVKPEPVVTAQTAMTCSNVALNFNLATLVSGGTFTYTVASSDATNVPAGSARAMASATAITDNYVNTTGSNVTITYTITPIGLNGCAGNAFDLVVTVKPQIAPSAITFTGNGAPTGFEVCSANNFTLTGTPSGGVWSVTGGAFASSNTATPGAITFTAITAAPSVTYTVTNASGCATTVNATAITVNALPGNSTITAPTFALCEGQMVTLTASTPTSPRPGAVLTSTWAYPGGTANVTRTQTGIYTIKIVANTPAIVPSSTFIVQNIVEDEKGCFSAIPATGTVTVYSPVTASATPVSATSCSTNSAGFTVNTTKTPAAATGVWTAVSGVTFTETTAGVWSITGVPADNTAHTYTYTVTNGACSTSTTVSLTNYASPMITATPATQTQCNDGLFNLTATTDQATGSWSSTTPGLTFTQGSGNAWTVSGVPATLASATAVTLTWSVTNGTCAPVSTSVTVKNDASPTTAVAGIDKEACGGLFTVIANGGVTPSVGTGSWSLISGPGAIQAVVNPTTVIVNGVTNVSGIGVTTMRYTVVNGSVCPQSTDDVELRGYTTPTADAHTSATNKIEQCATSTFTMAASSSPSTATGVWSIVSAPITFTVADIANSTSATTVVNNVPVDQPVVLQWTVSNGSTCPTAASTVELINYSTPVITAGDASGTPISGVDYAKCSVSGSATFTMNATKLPAAATGLWTVTSVSSGSTSAVVITNPTLIGATVEVPAGVTATLKWEVTNGSATFMACTLSVTIKLRADATVTSIITTTPTPQCDNLAFTLNGTAVSGASYEWTATGGSASPTNTVGTTVTLSGYTNGTASGTATFKVINGTCSDMSTVNLTAYEKPTGVVASTNTYLLCAATGPAFTVTGTTPPTWATGTWTVTSVSSGTFTDVVITNTTSPSTTVSVPAGVDAILTWTVAHSSSAACNASDTVLIKNNPVFLATLVPIVSPTQPTELCRGGQIVFQGNRIGGSGIYPGQSFTTIENPIPGGNFSFTFISASRQGTITASALAVPQTPITALYTVFDNVGCSATATYVTKINPVIAPSIASTIGSTTTNNVCQTSDIKLTATTGGGSGMFSTPSWSITGGTGGGTLSATSGGSVDLTGTTAGTVIVQYSVTDTKTLCSSATSITITVNELPRASISSSNTPQCSGSNAVFNLTGTANAIVTYNLNGGASATATLNSSGTATVTVNSATANQTLNLVSVQNATTLCTESITGTSTVVINPLPMASVTNGGLICAGQNAVFNLTGTANATVTYNLNGGSSTTVTLNGSGTAIVTVNSATTSQTLNLLSVQDATTLCVKTYTGVSSTLAVNPPLSFTSAAVTSNYFGSQLSCATSTDGVITAVATGGTAPLTYTITNGSFNSSNTTGIFIDLAAGTYTVSLTDASNCSITYSSTLTITAPLAPLAGAVADVPNPSFPTYHVSCNGGSNGKITATAINGSGTFEYKLSGTITRPYQTSNVFTGLTAGSYTVTVKDANGCTATAPVILQQPVPITFLFVTPQSPSCNILNTLVSGNPNGFTNGTITVGAGGGLGSISYSINASASMPTYSASPLTGLSAGIYTVTAKDGDGCTATTSITIAAPTALSITASAPTAICSGAPFTTNSVSVIPATYGNYVWTSAATGVNSAAVATISGVPSGSTTSLTPTVTQTALSIGASTVTFTVTADQGGCATSAQVSTTINPLPFLTGVTTPDPTCPDAGAFGIAFTANPNSANQISVSAGTPTPMAGFVSVTNKPFTASPIGISTLPLVTLPTGVYDFNYVLTNTTTGCVSPSTNIQVQINPRPVVTSIAIAGGVNEICNAPNDNKQLYITTTGVPAGLPRAVLIERDSAGVKTSFSVSSGMVDNFTTAVSGGLKAGTYKVLGIIDVNSCSGTVSSGTVILKDARIVITKRILDTTVTVSPGCTPTLIAAAAFVSQPSMGTITYQWQVNRGTGFVDSSGATLGTLTLANPIEISNNNWKYRLKVESFGTTCNDTIYSGNYTITVGGITANAGGDQTLSVPTFTMAATAMGGSGVWTVVSGTATIANTGSPNTVVTLPTRGSVTLRWTVSNGLGCSTFDEVTLTRQTSQLFLTAFLQGPLVPAVPPTQPYPIMHDSLRVKGYIPLSSPYPNCPGTIAPSVLAVTGSNAIVDWVKVVIHGPFPSSRTIRVDSVAALIRRDGNIVGLDGVSAINFNVGGFYYVSVDHRNHLAVMTDRPMNLILSATSGYDQFDFTDNLDPNNTTFGTAQNVITGYRAMWSGDVNGDGEVKYNGGSNDRGLILLKLGGAINLALSGYNNEDVNMDGDIKYNGGGNDRIIILSNLGGSINSVKVQGF
jgi:PKD-like domain